ncbi:MAG: hydrogen peroxide-dependent heme synthase [Gemmatimonadota bacterium]|nr:hydrogen peroxide-dependent heme synthase [Gemmatimonadota bacterium]
MKADTHRSDEDRLPEARPGPGAQVAPATLDGWFVLHQLYRIDWPALASVEEEVARKALGELSALSESWDSGDGPWSGLYRMVGSSVDLMALHFRPTLEELTDAARDLSMSTFAGVLDLDHDYLSVVELGMYALTLDVASRVDPTDHEAYGAALREALAEQGEKAYVKRRLEPRQPEAMPYACYYPMDKRRGAHRNWYTLPLETRAELMSRHGSVGRRYAGRVSQVISGSIGLADWEWAVTLWAGNPLVFKEVVTEMRYDEASSEYAEFGRFFVGRRMDASDIERLLP